MRWPLSLPGRCLHAQWALALALAFSSVAAAPDIHAAAPVDATTEAERRYLIQVISDLDRAALAAKKAEREADPEARYRLDYEALARDLDEMRAALERHVNAPRRSPRKIPPLDAIETRKR